MSDNNAYRHSFKPGRSVPSAQWSSHNNGPQAAGSSNKEIELYDDLIQQLFGYRLDQSDANGTRDTHHLHAILPYLVQPDLDISHLLLSQDAVPQLELEHILLAATARLRENHPYMRLGDRMMLFMHPNKHLPLFSDAHSKKMAMKSKYHQDTPSQTTLPHVFDLAFNAYFKMMTDKQDQSILLLGEEGSGKSLSHRLITRHLCDLSKKSKKKSQVQSAILKVDSVLNAFGNCMTSLNADASRHARYVEYQFDKKGHMVGAKFIPFLLDRHHLTSIQEEGRNFHIFYYLLSGMELKEKERLKLNLTPFNFNYLQGKRSLNSSDYQNYQDLCENLKDLGIGRRQQGQLFQFLSAILHLGNIVFEDTRNSTEPCQVKNKAQLILTAELLGIDPEELESVLTVKMRQVGYDKISILLHAQEALEQRDSLARTLYTVVTTWVFDRINVKLCQESSEWAHFIAVLDIPGMRGRLEAADQNDFGTLLINYTNTRLYSFVEDVYHRLDHQNMLEKECLQVNTVQTWNKDALGLLASDASTSIFSCLEHLSRTSRSVTCPSDEVVLDALVQSCSTWPCFLSKSSTQQPSSCLCDFTVRHHPGCLVEYQVKSYCQRNLDIVQEDFVDMVGGTDEMSGSVNRFLRCLVHDAKNTSDASQPAGEKVSRAPTLKRGTTEKRAKAGIKTVISLYKDQLNEIMECLYETHTWVMFHVQPSRERMDVQGMRAQLSALNICNISSHPLSVYSTWMDIEQFVSKYGYGLKNELQYMLPADDLNWDVSAIGNEHVGQNIQRALQVGKGWKRRQFFVGSSRIFLNMEAWSSLENMLRDVKNKMELNPNNSKESEKSSETHVHHDDMSLLSDVESHYMSELDYPRQEGKLAQDKDIKKTETTTHPDAIEHLQPDRKETKVRKCWLGMVWLMTWWIPSWCLLKCGRMRLQDQQLAWREKVTLFLLILFCCAVLLFFIIGLGWVLCPTRKVMSAGEIQSHSKLGTSKKPIVHMYGEYFDVTDMANTHVDKQFASKYLLEQECIGQDISRMFSKEVFWSTYCPSYKKPPTFSLFSEPSKLFESGELIDHHSQISYKRNFIPLFQRKYRLGTVVWNMEGLTMLNKNNRRILIAYDRIYDVSGFFVGNAEDYNFFLGDETRDRMNYILKTFTDSPGTDASIQMNKLKQESREEWNDILKCLNGIFYIGQVDHRHDLACMVPNYVLVVATALLVSVIGFKFLAALQLGTKRQPEHREKFVICMVTCYTEEESSLRKTIDSLAVTKYDDKHKLIFVVCDGMIIGAGNEEPTPRYVLNILGVDPHYDPVSLKFLSLGEGNKQLNYGKVYSGLYSIQGRNVPFIVLVKVGKPFERQKPGNRGKRDSQMALMRFLSRVHYNQPLCPLELELYHHMKDVIGVEPLFYEFVLMVDADTEVAKDSLNRLISCMVRDSKIMGLCGETRISNEKATWVTMIQVYEYYISHHLSKAFESLFGTVTCLPGCFSMYRIRTATGNKPLLVSRNIIHDYSENVVDTLHMKNLLHLGEDRYLTTLLLKHFPFMKTSFTPDARCSTTSPEKWNVILSQRRRWINSTVHNLLELLFLPEMCGFCCFSMRFVVFIDLFATIIQPTALLYVIYLVLMTVLLPEQNVFPLTSIIMIGCVYGAQVIIFILKRQWQHIGWMVIYLLAMPVFSFWLPLYSFWHFDDFSWGSTRLVVNEKKGKNQQAETEEFDIHSIPLKYWREYELEKNACMPSPSLKSQSIQQLRLSGSLHSFSGSDIPFTPCVPQPALHIRIPTDIPKGSDQVSPISDVSVPISAHSIPSMRSSLPAAMVSHPNHRQSYVSPNVTSLFETAYPAHYQQARMLVPPDDRRGSASTVASSSLGYKSFYDPSRNVRMSMVSDSSRGSAMASNMPSDDALRARIRIILSESDLMQVTKKSLRAQLSHYYNINLSSRKEFINSCIDDILKENQ